MNLFISINSSAFYLWIKFLIHSTDRVWNPPDFWKVVRNSSRFFFGTLWFSKKKIPIIFSRFLYKKKFNWVSRIKFLQFKDNLFKEFNIQRPFWLKIRHQLFYEYFFWKLGNSKILREIAKETVSPFWETFHLGSRFSKSQILNPVDRLRYMSSWKLFSSSKNRFRPTIEKNFFTSFYFFRRVLLNITQKFSH